MAGFGDGVPLAQGALANGAPAPARPYNMLSRAVSDSSLGDGTMGRLSVVGAHVVLAACEAVGLRLRPQFTLPLRLGGYRRCVRTADRTEFFALADVFLGGEYRAVKARDPDVIDDLGANVGAATLYFNARFPAARICAVEADPDTARRLRRNVADLPQVEVVQAAVGSRTGRARLSSRCEAPRRDSRQALTAPGST